MKDTKQIKEELIKAIETIFEEQKPEFKVGQWVMEINEDWGHPCRIAKLLPNDRCIIDIVDDNSYTEDILTYPCDIFRLATPAEIELHLRKICDEKYIGKKVRCLVDRKGYIISENRHKNINTVAMGEYWMLANNDIGVCVYKQGKFAEIISDKKKLPKTRKEYEQLIMDWYDSDYISSEIDDFLKQYED